MVFTCVSDTGKLDWEIINHNNRQSFHSSAQISNSVLLNIFTVTLLSVTNNSIYQSTAVARNISVDYNMSNVSCNDGHMAINSQKLISIIIGKESGIHNHCNLPVHCHTHY